MTEPTPTETPAERMYRKHLKNVSKYQKNNRDTLGKKQKDYLTKIKEDPEKYKALQEKRHDYYIKNKKPKPVVLVFQEDEEKEEEEVQLVGVCFSNNMPKQKSRANGGRSVNQPVFRPTAL